MNLGFACNHGGWSQPVSNRRPPACRANGPSPATPLATSVHRHLATATAPPSSAEPSATQHVRPNEWPNEHFTRKEVQPVHGCHRQGTPDHDPPAQHTRREWTREDARGHPTRIPRTRKGRARRVAAVPPALPCWRCGRLACSCTAPPAGPLIVRPPMRADLDGPSRRIIVTPAPATAPPPAPAPQEQPAQPSREPEPEREKTPA